MSVINTPKKAARIAKGRVYSSEYVTKDKSKSIPIKTLKQQRDFIVSSRQKIEYKLNNLLPIEAGQEPQLVKHLREMDRFLTAMKPRRHRYPILSAEPLTWRDNQGWPSLVILSLEQNEMLEIRGTNQRVWNYLPLANDRQYQGILTDIITPCYSDVGEKLMKSSPQYGHSFIRMSLGNLLIPPSTRQKIVKAREFFDEQLYIIVEAKEWQVGKVIYPKPDPLIVGYEDGHLFLIDVFDLTPLEKLMASEYSMPTNR